jgi:predicted CoA-binding protein
MDHGQQETPGEFDLKKFFAEIRTIAVVGYSDNSERAGHYVSHYLVDQGYEVMAINPKFGSEVNGLKCFANLEAVPKGTNVDVVVVFRAPPFVPELFSKAAQMDPKPRYFVMQPGAESEEAAELARQEGITPLMICMKAAHGIWAK